MKECMRLERRRSPIDEDESGCLSTQNYKPMQLDRKIERLTTFRWPPLAVPVNTADFQSLADRLLINADVRDSFPIRVEFSQIRGVSPPEPRGSSEPGPARLQA